MGDFKVKRCLVLGGSGSIGSAICKILAREGVQFAFTYYKNKNFASMLASELSAAGFHYCDLSDPDSIQSAVSELIKKLGVFDTLICATGMSEKKFGLKLEDIGEEEIDSYFDVYARGVLLTCKAAVSVIKSTKSGNIVIIGSMDGIKTVPSSIHFATSKSALKGMIEAMSKELGDYDIKVNLIAPGIVEGGASVHLSDGLKSEYLKHCSMKRFAKPSEIAEVVAWFALENTYVTGQSIVLNGGL